jgi:nitroimidazol reductase NimA-like FMN-containing flavoprotein (pyridoxamine 5'-phosphate oxidase superfamily)
MTESTTAGPGADSPFYELTPEESRALLSRMSVGRIAFSHGNRVDIEPISYIYDEGWLFGRTTLGTKLGALGHRPWVAFEVDDVQGHFDWQSVVIHGSFHVLEREGSEYDIQIYDRALSLLKSRIPNYGTDADPGAFRTTLFGIHMSELVGRGARSRGK